MKRLKVIAACILSCVLVAPAAVTPAFANSAIIRETRYNGYGVVSVEGESSVLKVNSEKLYFDITTLPKYDDYENYTNKVTAEYKFTNPTSEKVVAKMGFPIDAKPTYFSDMSSFKAHIYSGETELESVKRHTQGNLDYSYVYDEEHGILGQAKTITDDYYADAFFNPDLTVTPYKFTLSGTDEDKEQWVKDNIYQISYTADLSLDKTKTRYISDRATADSVAVFLGSFEEEQYIYVLGEDNFDTLDFEIKCWRKGVHSYGKEISYPVNIEKQDTMTLKELALSSRKEDSDISDMDWYNGFMSRFNLKSVSPISTHELMLYEEDFNIWYVYTLEVEAGATVVNKVVAPIFPNEWGSGYRFKYFLSPASCWASFENLDIVIRTEYNISDIEIGDRYQGSDRVPGGYKLSYTELPEGDLMFKLYTNTSFIYNEVGGIGFSGALAVVAIVIGSVVGLEIIAGAVVAIIFLCKHKKEKAVIKPAVNGAAAPVETQPAAAENKEAAPVETKEEKQDADKQ